MSFRRSFVISTLSVLAGLSVNILTNPASEIAGRLGIPLLPLLLAVLLLTVLFSAILQALPSSDGGAPAHQLQIQLEQHRKALRQLKERCLSGQTWTASCVEKWQEHQRGIAIVKEALKDIGIPVKDELIDTEPAPKLGCGLRLALLVRHSAALLAVPLVFFAVGYMGAATWLQPPLTATLIARATATFYPIALVSPQPATATAQQVASPGVPGTAPVAVTALPKLTASSSPTPLPTQTQTTTPGPSVMPTPPIRPTFTPAATRPSPTRVPPSSLPVGCVEGRRITSPAPGEIRARGIIQVWGSAYSEPFQRYKIEMAPGTNPKESDFIWQFESSSPVTSGVLAEWDATAMPPGIYTLRLTVVKPDGNWYEPRCLIILTLK